MASTKKARKASDNTNNTKTVGDEQHEEYLTQEKFNEIKNELDYLKTTRRKEIAENLEYARSLGDLSENAEYQEARELQASTEERIRKIESILQSAKIVQDKKKSNIVGLGSVVTIQKDGEKETFKYNIVGTEEADMVERKISYLSPLGEAMIGKKKGELFSFQTPNGRMNYKVMVIS